MNRITISPAYRILLCALLISLPVSLSAQSEVFLGTQVQKESAIVDGNDYVIQSNASGTPYVMDAGTYYSVPNSSNTPTTACVYTFHRNTDGTWSFQNKHTGKYWGIPTYNTQLAPASAMNAGHWTLNMSSGIAHPSAPDASGVTRFIDRSSQKLVGWTSGTSVAQRIKIYELSEAVLSGSPLAELNNKVISVSAEPAADLSIGQWYVMFDRGRTGNNPHGYLYEQVSSHTLYNTTTVPEGRAETAARFLVRLADAGNGTYYIQNGFGNYFGAFTKSTAVPMTATAKETHTVAKIANTDSHFYLQCTSTGIILDANSLENGDATVVGWGTSAPTAIGGNNDWAFYPVEIEDLGEEIALFEESVQVNRCYQTCGRGNTDALLLRIDLSPFKDISKATLQFALNVAAEDNISELYLYETSSTEFLANIPAAPIAVTNDVSNTAALTISDVSKGSHHYWLCATIKDNATLGAILTANLTAVSYTTTQDVDLDVSSVGNPSRQGIKVFDQQNFIFKPTTNDCRFYRIPAMILDQNGNLVVATDKRYNSNSDLGNHKIDVVTMRSEDGGRTWQDYATVAVGDGYTAAYFGYGDAAMARAVNGDLVCIMASGSKMWGYGMVTAGYAKSTNNGKSWTLINNLLDSPAFYDENNQDGSLSVNNIFTTSGKGLTTTDGVIMFATNCRRSDTGNTALCYILYSTDNGSHWRLSNALAYSGCDESKLEQLNNGSLLLSVRQSGNRGWNTATYTKNADGTVTFNWGSQYRTSDIWGNACNADILYYSRSTEGQPDIMLHSYINTSGRESLQLNMSLDGGASWKSVYNIQPNGSCYSTMIKLPNGNVAILFEDSSYDVGNGYAINFVTITREQILDWFVKQGGVLPVGINSLAPTLSPKSEGIYSVSGQRLSKPQRGVNIIDGKKIIIR